MKEKHDRFHSPPTPSELPLLKVLWREGEQSAREVHDGSRPMTGWAYSSTRTTLERMVGKELVGRRDFHGVALYRARISRTSGLAAIAVDFARRVLEIEPGPVAALFFESDILSREEAQEIGRLVETPDDS